MILKAEVMRLFRELQGLIEKESSENLCIYHGLLDGTISEFIDDLDAKWDYPEHEEPSRR